MTTCYAHLPVEPLEEAALLPAVLGQGALVELAPRVVLARGRELDAPLPMLAQGGPIVIATAIVVVVAVLAWKPTREQKQRKVRVTSMPPRLHLSGVV